jgi:hypothetical protein
MTKFEVYIECGLENLGNYKFERIIEAKNVNEALEIANADNSTKWRYLKKIKEKKKDD